MSQKEYCSKVNLPWGVTMAFIFLTSAAFTWLTPLHLDDWGFMATWEAAQENNDSFWSALLQYYHDNRLYENGRIANLLSPFSTVIKPFSFLFPLLNGICFALIIFLGQILFCHSKDRFNFRVTVFLWILILFLLPWRDTIFVADYSLNYIWSAAFNLGIILILLKASSSRLKPGLFCLGILLSIFAGGWHESVAATTIFGLLILCLRRKFRFNLQFILLLFIYLISCAAFAITPSILNRISYETGFNDYNISLISFGSKTLPGILLCMVILIYLIPGSKRKSAINFFNSNLFLIGAGIIFSGYWLSFSVIPTPRSFFWPNLIAIILTVALIYKCSGKVFEKPAMTICATAGILLCLLQAGVTVFWQLKYLKEYQEIHAQIDKSESGTAFYDILQPGDLPYFTLKIPVQSAWINIFYYKCLHYYKQKPFLAVVPTVLKETELNGGRMIQGDLNIREYKGQLVSPYAPRLQFPTYIRGRAILKNRKEVKADGIGIPFVTEPFRHSDGQNRSDTLIYYRIADIDPANIESLQLEWINPEIN